MDLGSLLQSHSDDAPSGENLDLDPAFDEMVRLAQPGEEKQVGDRMVRGDEPDYREVAEKALVILGRSHDLRAAVIWAEAALHTKGLPGFAEATGYIDGCLDIFWNSCHPQLDEEDDDDPTMRCNAVQGLAGANTMLHALRRAPLSDSRSFGRISLRDIAIAEGAETAPEGTENILDAASVAAAFQDTDAALLAEYLTAAKTAAENVGKIDAKFAEEVPGLGPDLDPLIKMLTKVVGQLAKVTGGDAETSVAEDAAPGPAPSAPAIGGINSPADVSNTLDRIIGYYERAEPSSPVPILLSRAKRLVNADFMTIMKDMAPSGVENVNLIGGFDDE